MKLTVEDGRLVPASAWDQERLLTYRNRSTVNAYITQDKPRWMERKYWAILDRVITTCGVKQRTAEDLHDHIKLKLGFVNAKFDDNGKLKVTLKSTKLMEDPEYEGFFKEAMGFLFELTGVDPMTLKKESADVGGEDESEPSEAQTPPASDVGRDADPIDVAATLSNASEGYDSSDGASDDSGGAGSPATDGAAAPNSNADDGYLLDNGVDASSDSGSATPVTGGAAATNPAHAAGQAGEDLTGLSASPAECIEKMMATALDKTITPQEAAEILADSADMWLGVFPDERRPFVTAVFQTCKKVLRNELKPDSAKRYLEGLAA